MKPFTSTPFTRLAANACFAAALTASAAGALLAAKPAHAATPAAPVSIDQTAPVIARHDIDIDASLSTVWAMQTDISAWTQWRPSVTAAHFDGTLTTGSVFHWEEGGLQIASTVQEIVPQRRIVWTGPAQGIFAVHVWEFTPTAHGVHVHTEESWSGAPVQASAATLQPMLDGALQEWLQRLKKVSEAGKVQ